MLQYVFYVLGVLLCIVFMVKFFQYKKESIDKNNTILSEILEVAFSKQSLPEAAQIIFDTLMHHYRIDYCSIFVYEKGRKHLNLLHTTVNKEYALPVEEYANGLFNKISERKDTAALRKSSNAVLDDYPAAFKRKIKYYYFIPFKSGADYIGALFIENRDSERAKSFELAFFKIIVKNISIVLQNLLYFHEIKNSAYTDSLTGAYNREYMNIFIGEKLEEYHNYDKCFSIAIFDIDHFKKFNDTHGHLVGDYVLCEVVRFVSDNLRKSEDKLFRYGGEEFIIFLSNVNAKEGYDKIEDIRRRLSEIVLKKDDDTELSVTASFGIADCPGDGSNLKGLIECADNALYKAKNGGRNQVMLYNK